MNKFEKVSENVEPLPLLIQGGMGIGVSGWQLAKAVSRTGQLGVISGTAADTLLVRRLQDGDVGGHVRRALQSFPRIDIVERILSKYFNSSGRTHGRGYKVLPLYDRLNDTYREFITMAGTFVEVFLAKEGHEGKVGMNLLTKIQLPTIASIYGALLAGVDYLLMGAGIPREIPSVLKNLVRGERAEIKLDVKGGKGDEVTISLDPQEFFPTSTTQLVSPKFIPIVSSHSLAQMLLRRSQEEIDGFVVEDNRAGGHNAPPRDGQVDENGEAVYGDRDIIDFSKIKDLGKPFWIAGGASNNAFLKEALTQGAAGVQVGSLFALSRESSMSAVLKKDVISRINNGDEEVKTDSVASPTGFPFKIFSLPETLSDDAVYENRERRCDLGLLRTAFRKLDGTLGFRCSGEPVKEYLEKGGEISETVGRRCICNALFSAIDLSQIRRSGYIEPPLVTTGSMLKPLRELISVVGEDYSASQVVEFILGERS